MSSEEMTLITNTNEVSYNQQSISMLSVDKKRIQQKQLSILEGDSLHGRKLSIENTRLCKCGPTHINCMSPKDWLKSQIGVWQFLYEARDIRDKSVHPATFPISLA